jgi:hypothetical protein
MIKADYHNEAKCGTHLNIDVNGWINNWRKPQGMQAFKEQYRLFSKSRGNQ